MPNPRSRKAVNKGTDSQRNKRRRADAPQLPIVARASQSGTSINMIDKTTEENNHVAGLSGSDSPSSAKGSNSTETGLSGPTPQDAQNTQSTNNTQSSGMQGTQPIFDVNDESSNEPMWIIGHLACYTSPTHS